jgi:starch-binding outer membrane protein, SusD/RagB family
MKSRNYIAIIIAATLGLTACEKVVDIDPIAVITKDSALRTEADFLALLNSTYTVLAADSWWGGRWQTVNDLLADHIAAGELTGNYQGIYNRSVDIFNTNIADLYRQPWYALARANAVLESLSRLSGASRDNAEGQAKFIRAIGHFDLVRLWAQPYVPGSPNTQPGIPIKDTSAPGEVNRASVGEVYAKVIADLTDAEALLPDANGVYPTKWAAKALLARVYFQMNDFAKAYDYSNQVIASGKFAFDSDFKNRFSRNGTTESVFQLVYETKNPTGRFNELRNPYRTNQAGLPALRVSSSLAGKALGSLDKRKDWYKTVNGTLLTTKYDTLTFKLPVLHLTEMKFIRAESASELNTNLNIAIGDVNDIINRAYGPASPFVVAGTATAGFIRDAVRRERELELVFEGDRLQQLKRMGAKGENVVVRNAPWNCNGLVLIFPANEVNFNPGFVQNPIGGCQ